MTGKYMCLPNVTPTMALSCAPLPTSTDSSMVLGGVLNTSPCTNFHPQSSWTSSCDVQVSLLRRSNFTPKTYGKVNSIVAADLREGEMVKSRVYGMIEY